MSDTVQWVGAPAQFGVWYWHTPELNNGWTPQVVDDSQMFAPKRRTRYHINAVCRWWIVGHPEELDTLEEAKRIALLLALSQRPASSDSSCRVEPERAAKE